MPPGNFEFKHGNGGLLGVASGGSISYPPSEKHLALLSIEPQFSSSTPLLEKICLPYISYNQGHIDDNIKSVKYLYGI